MPSRKSHKGSGSVGSEEVSENSSEKPLENILEKPSEKEYLLGLYKELKDLGVNRLSQLENLIAKAE